MKTNQGNPIEVGEGAGVGRVPLPHLPTPGTSRGLQPMGSRHPEPSFTPVNVCSTAPQPPPPLVSSFSGSPWSARLHLLFWNRPNGSSIALVVFKINAVRKSFPKAQSS